MFTIHFGGFPSIFGSTPIYSAYIFSGPKELYVSPVSES